MLTLKSLLGHPSWITIIIIHLTKTKRKKWYRRTQVRSPSIFNDLCNIGKLAHRRRDVAERVIQETGSKLFLFCFVFFLQIYFHREKGRIREGS